MFLAIAEPGERDEAAGKGATRGASAADPCQAASAPQAGLWPKTPPGMGRRLGQDLQEVIAAVDAGVLFEHPEEVEVGGALVGAEAVHRARTTAHLAEASLHQVVGADGVIVIFGRDAFEGGSEAVDQPGEVFFEDSEGVLAMGKARRIDNHVNGGHEPFAFAFLFGERVTFSDPGGGVVFEVPGAALHRYAGEGGSNRSLDRLVAVTDDGEWWVVAADCEFHEGPFPRHPGYGLTIVLSPPSASLRPCPGLCWRETSAFGL